MQIYVDRIMALLITVIYLEGGKMKYPIRILHVLGRLDRGGAETMVMNLYRQMDRKQIQFDFILHTTDECSYSEEVRALGGRIYAVPAYTPSAAGQYRSAWKKFFGEHPEYKILHSHIRSTASLYLPIAKKYGLTTIVHSHNTSSGKGIKAAVKSVLQYPLRFQADYLFACGRAAGEWLFGKRACGSERFFILPNAIETEKFKYNVQKRQEVRKSLGCHESTLVIGHVGRFERQKNHNFLLRIFAEIEKERPDSRLILVGEGELREKTEQAAMELELTEKTVFLGNRDDVNELLQGMDAMVFPSLYEGLPVTIVEAQAAGLPVLMSDRVTKEVIMTELVHQQSLPDGKEDVKDNAKNWACKVFAISGERRIGREQEIKTAGYDITMTAQWLWNFYRKLF